MAEPFLSEIRIFGFNYAPKSWAMCNGQFLPINQNQALFSLLGTTYGGNGQTTFALPDLRAKVPIHVGNGHTLGETGGSNAVTLNIQQLPQHIHFFQATNDGPTATAPASDNVIASSPSNTFAPSGAAVAMADTVKHVGGSQPHENRQPYLGLNFCIALQGIFPSPN
jgi:microcystin-dependent protein